MLHPLLADLRKLDLDGLECTGTRLFSGGHGWPAELQVWYIIRPTNGLRVMLRFSLVERRQLAEALRNLGFKVSEDNITSRRAGDVYEGSRPDVLATVSLDPDKNRYVLDLDKHDRSAGGLGEALERQRLDPSQFNLNGLKAYRAERVDGAAIRAESDDSPKGTWLVVKYSVTRAVAFGIEEHDRPLTARQLAQFTSNAKAAGFPLRRPIQQGDVYISAPSEHGCLLTVEVEIDEDASERSAGGLGEAAEPQPIDPAKFNLGGNLRAVKAALTVGFGVEGNPQLCVEYEVAGSAGSRRYAPLTPREKERFKARAKAAGFPLTGSMIAFSGTAHSLNPCVVRVYTAVEPNAVDRSAGGLGEAAVQALLA